MLGQYRSLFEPIKNQVARPLIALGIRPLTVTLTGLVLSVLSLFCSLLGWPFLAFLTAMIASLTDLFDGAVARGSGQVTQEGDFLEAVIDKMVEMVLLFGLAWHNPMFCFLAAASAFLVSYVKPRLAQVIPSDNHDWPGLGDHPDRMVLVVSGYFFVYRHWPLAIPLALLTLINLVGAAQRILYALQLIQRRRLAIDQDTVAGTVPTDR